MLEGKVFGKGLTYIYELDQTIDIEEINIMNEDQFSTLLSFCDECELEKLYSKLAANKSCYKSVQVLKVLCKC